MGAYGTGLWVTHGIDYGMDYGIGHGMGESW